VAYVPLRVANESYLNATTREDDPRLYSVNACLRVLILYALLLPHTHVVAAADQNGLCRDDMSWLKS
jgi:hypothetical protein